MRTLDVFAAETSRTGVKLYINGAVRHGCETRWFDRLQEVDYILRDIEELGRNLPTRMLELAHDAGLMLAERLIISSTRPADMAAAIACAVPLYAALAAFMDAIRSLEGVTANVGG
jgi:hypothetical protein